MKKTCENAVPSNLTYLRLEHPQCSTVNDAVSLQNHGLFIKNSKFKVILRRLQCCIVDALIAFAAHSLPCSAFFAVSRKDA